MPRSKTAQHICSGAALQSNQAPGHSAAGRNWRAAQPGAAAKHFIRWGAASQRHGGRIGGFKGSRQKAHADATWELMHQYRWCLIWTKYAETGIVQLLHLPDRAGYGLTIGTVRLCRGSILLAAQPVTRRGATGKFSSWCPLRRRLGHRHRGQPGGCSRTPSDARGSCCSTRGLTPSS